MKTKFLRCDELFINILELILFVLSFPLMFYYIFISIVTYGYEDICRKEILLASKLGSLGVIMFGFSVLMLIYTIINN